MIIVAGHLVVDPHDRDDYLRTCVDVVGKARQAPGCLDFSVTADLIDESRVNVYERWDSGEHVEAFRAEGPSEEQRAMLRGGTVEEYEVTDARVLLSCRTRTAGRG